MKASLILFFFCLLNTFSASAQFEKGTFSFGGSLSGNTTKTTYPALGSGVDYKLSQQYISIFPQVGYFVLNKFLVGAGINYQYGRDNQIMPGYGLKSNVSALSLSPYLRYYVKHFYAMAGLSAGYGRVYASEYQVSYSSYFTDANTKTTFFQKYYCGIGYAIMVTPQVAIEPVIGYQCTHDYPSVILQKENQAAFYFSIGLQVYLHREG